MGEKNLHSRIRRLVKDGRITVEMGDWADHIRVLGNEAAHDPEEITEKEATELKEFVEVFFTYAFTLPTRMIESRQSADDAENCDED